MSTAQIWQINSPSLEATLQLAENIGQRLKGGEVVELVSDLGGGKTAFVKGLVRGAGSSDRVSSPSFTLSNIYETPELTLHHYDFYRLDDPGIMRQEIGEVLADDRSVVLVEWGAIVEDVLPAERLTVRLTPTGQTGRRLDFAFPARYNYLLPAEGRR